MKNDRELRVREDGTLLAFLLAALSAKSRNHVKGLLRRGQIAVDGVVCTDYARPLRAGQCVTLRAAPVSSAAAPPFAVLYEDAELMAVDKPAGLLTVSTDKVNEETAFFAVNRYLRAHDPAARAFIVHRLDRDTSGVLLLAKSHALREQLQQRWEELALERRYVALCEGRVEPPEGRVESWLKQTRTLLVYSSGREGDGKRAVTRYQTRLASERCTLLDVWLETGRKNQIRVHMRDIGHSVAGDKKYGAVTDPLGRLCLHAAVLRLRHPRTGGELHLEADTPPGFARVITEDA